MKPSGAIFSEQMQTWRLGVDVKKQPRRPRGCPGRPLGVGAPPTLVGPSSVHRPTSSSYIYPCTPKTSEATTKNYFHRRNLLYLRDSILEPSSALRRRGNQPWRASTPTLLPLLSLGKDTARLNPKLNTSPIARKINLVGQTKLIIRRDLQR